MAKDRLLKWVGQAPMLRKDRWSVANWKYENRRRIASARHTLIITPYDIVGKDDDGNPITKPNGISQEYVWDWRNKSRILLVKGEDAEIILRRYGNEFVDVSNIAEPEKVHNKPIILPV